MVLYKFLKNIPASAGLAMDTRFDLSLLEEHNLNPLHYVLYGDLGAIVAELFNHRVDDVSTGSTFSDSQGFWVSHRGQGLMLL